MREDCMNRNHLLVSL